MIAENPPVSLVRGSTFPCLCPIKSRSVSEGLVFWAFLAFCFILNHLSTVVWISSTLLSLCVLQQPQASLLYYFLDANPLALLFGSFRDLSFLLFPFFVRVYFPDAQHSTSELFSQGHVKCFVPSVYPFLVPLIWGF